MINPDIKLDIYGTNDSEALEWLRGRGGSYYSVDYNGNNYSVRFTAKDWDKKVELKCGCILLGNDGSKIACWEHTSAELKKSLKESVKVR